VMKMSENYNGCNNLITMEHHMNMLASFLCGTSQSIGQE